MTFQQARQELRAHNMTIVKSYGDEYRVNYRGGKLVSAYYTTDLADAVTTGIRMRQHRDQYDYTKARAKDAAMVQRGAIKSALRKLAYRAIRWTN